MSGVIMGAPQIALNESDASIHDSDAALRLGFRGSAVAGVVHLDCFVPPLLEAFGQAWFEHGSISLYFENIIVSGEQVESAVQRPVTGDPRVRVHAQRAGDPGFLVTQGSASMGFDPQSELRTRDLRLCDPSELRLLKGVMPGQSLGEMTRTVSSQTQSAALRTGGVNTPLPWYSGSSPWGDPIACPSHVAFMMLRMANADDGTYFPQLNPAIGNTASMFGAMELAHINGPVFLDRPYTVRGMVVGVGQSPKTEYVWWDASAFDASGTEIVRIRHLFRIIKAASPLYAE